MDNSSTIANKNIVVIVLKFIGILSGSILLGSSLYYFVSRLLIVNSINILSLFVILFILAQVFKMNYISKLFIINLLVGSALVSFYPFGQGFIIVMLLITSQKLLKLF